MEDKDYQPPDISRVHIHMDYLGRRDCEHIMVLDVYPSKDTELQQGIITRATGHVITNKDVNCIKDVNKKGEIALHMGAFCITPDSPSFIEKLIKIGVNVNARNIWGQTALHYSTFSSLANIEKIVSVYDIDVNIQDCNGYNALHCLLSSSKDTVPMEDAMNILIKAGTDINSQTNYGNSILHLAAERKDDTSSLEYLATQFYDIDLTLKNKFGDNFLHTYVEHELTEKIMDLCQRLVKVKGRTSLNKLLDDKNKMGRTPWNIMIDNNSMTKSAMETILGYGISVPIQDSLGNTVLHRIGGVFGGGLKTDILEVLIEYFNDVNIKNIFGEPAGSVLFVQDVFDVFYKYQMNFNIKDRWDRDSLISMMKQHPRPDLLQTVIKKGGADVNSRDSYLSTPLHFAAYHNFSEQVELLLACGADISAKDKLGDTPLETCRRHCSYACHNILEVINRKYQETLYIREQRLYAILNNMPNQISSSSMKSLKEVQNLLGLPKDTESFFSNLLKEYYHYLKSPQNFNEMGEVNASVQKLVKGICEQMNKYDSVFKLSVYPTGSMSEGTKVGRPDEFDFIVSFDELVSLTEPVIGKRCAKSNFVCLKFKESPVREKYLPYSDRDGFFLAYPILQYFFRYLKQALNEPHLWRDGNLYYNFEDKVYIVDGKPVFNFEVSWVGSVYKQLKISIDIVPAVYMQGYWPPNIDSKLYEPDGNIESLFGIKLMTKDIQNAGCFLIFQTKNLDFEKKRYNSNENISSTCNLDDWVHEYPKRRMLRVSAAPAEICLMKSLPDKFRQAYALAKIVKSKVVCPTILIDVFPTDEYKLTTVSNQKRRQVPVIPYDRIKSYMLKNCLFNIYQEMSAQKQNFDEITVPEITGKMYHYLLYLADEQSLKPYFLPYCNIFEGEQQKSKDDGFLFLLERELSIKLVLGILNHRFPRKCLARTEKHPISDSEGEEEYSDFLNHYSTK